MGPPKGARSRRIAEILRDCFAATAAAEPEALAHHFMQAGLTDAAIEWWGNAGDQALRRSAFQEAISHLGKAIEMADKASESAPGRHASKRFGQPATDSKPATAGRWRGREGSARRKRRPPLPVPRSSP
jgi:hypothetical protein